MKSSVHGHTQAVDRNPGAAAGLIDDLMAEGVDLVIGVPCSHLHSIIVELEERDGIQYRSATNEGEATSIAVGWRLAGGSPVVLMQNSGLGNAVNPITSLSRTLQVPFLMIVSWRGEPGKPDEPQHEVMGRITPDLLSLMEVDHAVLPFDADERSAMVHAAFRRMKEGGRPYALIVRKGVFEKPTLTRDTSRNVLSRGDVIREVVRSTDEDTLIVSTTGFTSRELEAHADSSRNLYIVGSMGCASSVALGVAERAQGRRVIVLDGDGAVLMRLEAMASIGRSRANGLIHIVLDNASYESTGGQPSSSGDIDFPGVARACGYRFATTISGVSDIRDLLNRSGSEGPILAHLPIAQGAPAGLGRPVLKPMDSAARFARHIERTHHADRLV